MAVCCMVVWQTRGKIQLRVSLIYLTYNRPKAAEKCFEHNSHRAGYDYHEVIHVDNGSDEHGGRFDYLYSPEIVIRHSTNLGVSKGYNRGYLNATGSHVLITGMDRLLPQDWLKRIVHYFENIPQTGVISIYGPPIREGDDYTKSRYLGHDLTINGLKIQPAIPFEARICSRDFFLKCGFLREDFEMYGYEDNEWGMRANRIARENGLINYIIPGLDAEHYKDDSDFLMNTGQTHRAFKDSFLEGNRKRYEQLKRLGFPYYNPYI